MLCLPFERLESWPWTRCLQHTAKTLIPVMFTRPFPLVALDTRHPCACRDCPLLRVDVLHVPSTFLTIWPHWMQLAWSWDGEVEFNLCLNGPRMVWGSDSHSAWGAGVKGRRMTMFYLSIKLTGPRALEACQLGLIWRVWWRRSPGCSFSRWRGVKTFPRVSVWSFFFYPPTSRYDVFFFFPLALV